MTTSRASWPSDGERRPRVLLADDNASILAKVSTLLERNFDVVAAVTGGRQALHAAQRLDPDVAVLDITMPDFDGFETARALRQSGLRAKVVMLTMHQSDEFVAAAIEASAQGYVLKTRIPSDLESAIGHAIAGRLFLPSLTSLLSVTPSTGAGWHAMQFGISDRPFFNKLSALLAATRRQGDVTALVATDASRTAIAQRLLANGIDIAQAAGRGQYIWLDAREALSKVMVGGRIDAHRVAAIVDDLERSRLAASASSVTVIGELAPSLCRDGNPEAALHLERVWDDLTRGLPFLTVCFYSKECFGERDDSALFPGICAPHAAVCHADHA
jgi:two-component system, NarL family, response regulator NreC